MTCIVGLKTPSGIYIGGDSCSSANELLMSRADEKVFRVGEFLFGCADSFRVAQVIRYGFEIPAQLEDQSDMQYLVTTFSSSLRGALKSCGTLRIESGSDDMEADIVFGFRGELFELCRDFQIAMNREGYAAAGIGAMAALGALHVTPKVKDPRKRLKMALEAAAHHVSGVVPPFQIVKL